jgi:predicted TIM-barrel fold metal-dependent hydrolase
MKPTRIINVHTHAHRHQDLDARVRHWQECGCVKVCVHVLWLKPGDSSYSNEELLPWMRKYPDLLLGFALPHLGARPGGPVDGPEVVDRFKEQGFTGLKFIGPSYAYDDERYYPLYRRAEELEMPVLFHTGFLSIRPTDGERGISQDKMRALRLDTIGRAFPRLRMMMAHLGNPEYPVGLDLIRSFPNLYGEFSGASGSKFRETTLRKLFAPLPGADLADPDENLALVHFQKLCFATDNPEPPRWIELSQRLMDELHLPVEVQEGFWWRNGARWLGIEDTL